MKEKIKSYALILLGLVLTAMAISLFFVPNKIVNGGSSGLSTVVFYTLGLKPSVTNALINAILLIISAFSLGKAFVARTVVSIGLLSVFIELFSFLPPVTEDMLLAAIFGSALYGVELFVYSIVSGYPRAFVEESHSVPRLLVLFY